MTNSQPSVNHSEKEEPTLDWEKHLRWLAPLTAIILIAVTVIMWTQNKSTSIRSEVLQSFTMASTADQFETIAEAYPDQPEAPLATLQAASLYYNEGEFQKAQAQYELFLASYPSHPLIQNANWGKWMSQESLGDLDAALEGYKTLDNEDLFYPQSLFGQARIMEKKNLLQEALDLYSKVQEEFPNSNWAEQAKIFSERAELSI